MHVGGTIDGKNVDFYFDLTKWQGFCAGTILSGFSYDYGRHHVAGTLFVDNQEFSKKVLETIADEIFEDLQGTGQHLLVAADTIGGNMGNLFDPLPLDQAFEAGEYTFLITADLSFNNANTGNRVFVRKVLIAGEGRGGDSESDYFDDEDDDV
jgi:hypothetical protein